ncbi:hypothetical protein BJ508DRAFT_309563 [Ascobolus immersus RN42]|uniref:Uncharacterized protein n=1 Tax=Ascobolus immersus RN42 TaxID=1160509 RepID=A0A3N4HY26_ASCIM|nr:hypothetical protein BJ508DRAFT_309563 [Ascobolus immersus RN42]
MFVQIRGALFSFPNNILQRLSVPPFPRNSLEDSAMLHVKHLFVYEPANISSTAKCGDVAFVWTPNDLINGNGRKPRVSDEVTFTVVYPTPETADKFKDGPGVRLVSSKDGHFIGWVRVYDKSILIERLEKNMHITGTIMEGYKSPWANAGRRPRRAPPVYVPPPARLSRNRVSRPQARRPPRLQQIDEDEQEQDEPSVPPRQLFNFASSDEDSDIEMAFDVPNTQPPSSTHHTQSDVINTAQGPVILPRVSSVSPSSRETSASPPPDDRAAIHLNERIRGHSQRSSKSPAIEGSPELPEQDGQAEPDVYESDRDNHRQSRTPSRAHTPLSGDQVSTTGGATKDPANDSSDEEDILMGGIPAQTRRTVRLFSPVFADQEDLGAVHPLSDIGEGEGDDPPEEDNASESSPSSDEDDYIFGSDNEQDDYFYGEDETSDELERDDNPGLSAPRPQSPAIGGADTEETNTCPTDEQARRASSNPTPPPETVYEAPGSNAEDTSPTLLASLFLFLKWKPGQDEWAEFVDMVNAPYFKKEELPKSISTFKRMIKKQLGTLDVRRTKVRCTKVGGDTKSKEFVDSTSFEAPYLVASILNNPTDVENMHFGLGIKAMRISEAYHARMWWESILAALSAYPLFNSARQSVHPGTFIMARPSSSSASVLTRITGIFRREIRAKDADGKETEMLDTSDDNVWATIEPVLRSMDDVEPFGLIASTDTRESMIEEFSNARAILLCAEYEIQLKRLGEVFPSVSVQRDHKKWNNPNPEDTLLLRYALFPEKDSYVNKDLFIRHVPKSRQNIPQRRPVTRSRSTTPNSRQPSRTNTALDPTLPSRAPKRPTAQPRTNGIHVRSLVSMRHVRKLLAEEELEYGEVTPDMLEANDKDEVGKIGVVMDISSDGFGVFSTTHRVATGIYCSVLNMDHKARDELRSRHLIGFGPSESNKRDVMEPILADFKRLAHGVLCRIGNETRRVHVKVLFYVVDMVEGNDVSGIKASTAEFSCRWCIVGRSDYGDDDYERPEDDRARLARQKHIVEDERKYASRMRQLYGDGDADKELTKSGLSIHAPLLSDPTKCFAFNVHVQTAQDAPHSELKGSSMNLLQIFRESLSDEGKAVFTRYWRKFPLPPDVSRKPNPMRTDDSKLKQSEISVIVSCLPFVLKNILDCEADISGFFKPIVTLEAFRDHQDEIEATPFGMYYPPTVAHMVTHLGILEFAIRAFFITSKSNYNAFLRNISYDHYELMEQCLVEARRILAKFAFPFEERREGRRVSAIEQAGAANTAGKKRADIPSKVHRAKNKPNHHVGPAHLARSAKLFGTNMNTSSSPYDQVHRRFKYLVSHSNLHDMDGDFMGDYTVMNSVRRILETVDRPDLFHQWHRAIKVIEEFTPGIVTGGYYWGKTAVKMRTKGLKAASKNKYTYDRESLSERFSYICPSSYIGVHNAELYGLPTVTWGLDVDDPLIADLANAYMGYGITNLSLNTSKTASGRIEWWRNVTLYDELAGCKYSISIGQVLPVLVKGTPEARFVMVRGIAFHPYAWKTYCFLYVNWMEKQGNDPDMYNLPLYRTQTRQTFISIQSLLQQRPPHFVKHSTRRNYYYHNLWNWRSI